MTMSVSGASPVSYASTPSAQPNDAASFEQLLSQLASNYGVSPQELFNMITSYANQPGGGGSPAYGSAGSGGAAGVGGPAATGGSGSVNNSDMQKVLGQFAANTLNAGQGMMKEAMDNFFKEEEPDEDDPDAESL
jgi:hypothetical protein